MICPRFSPSLDARDLRAFLSGFFDGEETVAAFERAFARKLGRRHAFTVPSARAGLYFLLTTCGREKGGAVLPALTYYAVPDAARLAGFPPVFCDVRIDTLLMDEERAAGIEPGAAKVIIPTHLYGRVQDMDAVMKTAKEKGWLVIEDAAQGLGASWRGRPCGSIGDAAYFTFGPTKNFTTLGGGMIVLDDDAWAERISEKLKPVRRASAAASAAQAAYGFAMSLASSPPVFWAAFYPLLRLFVPRGVDVIERATLDPPRGHALVPRAFFEGNPRGAQAKVGLAQLEKLEILTAKRRRYGTRLAELLEDAREIEFPRRRSGEDPGYMSFPVLTKNPRDFAARLLRHGVDTAKGYMTCCADLDLFREQKADCPNARRAEAEMSHLPVHPALPEGAMEHIARAVRASAINCEL